MEINSTFVQNFLEENKIEFDWKEIAHQNFEVASLFNLVDNGFYFYNGEKEFPFPVNNSLILVEYFSAIKLDGKNQFVLLKEDSQSIYYQILAELFGRKSNGIISKNAIIHPEAKIGNNVQIDDFCIIEKCEIGDNVIINSFSKIHENSIIGKNTIIETSSIIGTQGVAWVWNKEQDQRIIQPQLGNVVIGENCFLGANTIIVRGSLNEASKIGNNTLLAPGSRIGHGTQIGNFVHFANSIVTGGNTQIGDFSFVGSAAVFRPKVKIHPKTIVGSGSVVVKNTSGEGFTLIGVPAKETETKEAPSGMPKPKL